MLNLGQFSAWITVDGEHLETFDVKNSANATEITCWIPSTSGKEFTVNWRREHLLTPMAGDVYLDGKFAGGKVMDVNGGLLFRKDSFQKTQTTLRRYVFADLELTDDDLYLNKAPSQLGEIRLDIHQACIIGESKIQGLTTFPSPTKVHERAKKAFSHQIKLGKEQDCSRQKYTDVIRQRKLVSFRFKYRPLDRLKADGIAPRDYKSSGPVQPKIKSRQDFDEDEEDERRIRLLEAELEALRTKRRRMQGRSTQEPQVKEEPQIKTEPATVKISPVVSSVNSFKPPRGPRNPQLGLKDLTNI